MDPTTLQKKSIKRAFTSSGNMIAGACSLLASAAFVNPLPFILYGLGSLGWMYRSVISGTYTKEILQEEHKAQASRVANQRHSLEYEVSSLFETPAISRLMGDGMLPDYMKRYYVLNTMREQIVSIAHERGEVGDMLEEDIVKQMDYMLTAFLRLVHSRLLYMQVLLGVYVERRAAEKPRRKVPKILRGLVVDPDSEENDAQAPHEFSRRRKVPVFRITADDRMRELEAQRADLERRASEESSAAEVYQTHVGLLTKQIDLLRECKERDSRVSAQLDAFVSAFQFTLDRLRASQFEASEVTTFISSMVEQVDETVRFVEAVRPGMGMDDLFMQINTLTATA